MGACLATAIVTLGSEILGLNRMSMGELSACVCNTMISRGSRAKSGYASESDSAAVEATRWQSIECVWMMWVSTTGLVYVWECVLVDQAMLGCL